TGNRLRDDIYAGMGSGEPPLPAAQWSHICLAPFDAMRQIVSIAADLTLQRANEREASAELHFWFVLVGLLATALVTLWAFILVRCRVTRPLGRVIATIGRLSRHDHAAVEGRPSNTDEFAALS